MEEKELFEHYEHKQWEWTPKLYKIFGVATIIPLLLVTVIGQFNLLQTRACDSVIANKVCQVLDAVYVSSSFTTTGEWKDGDWVKSKFDDMDVIMVDVTNAEPPFTYPEGYFALVNEDELTFQPLPPDSGDLSITSTQSDPLQAQNDPLKTTPSNPSNGGLFGTRPKLPKPSKPIEGDDSGPIFTVDKPNKTSVAKTPNTKPSKPDTKLSNDSPSKLPKLGDGTTAKNGDNSNTNATNTNPEPKKTDNQTNADVDLTSFQPNKRPLNELRDLVKEKVAKNEVDLKAPFSVTIEGVLKDGKLDEKKTKFTNSTGDPKMVDLAKNAITYVNDSGLFTYLKDLSDKRLLITLQQDNDNITVVLKSQVDTESKAKTIASGFNFLISFGKTSRKGKDEEIILNGAKVTSEGKVFIMNFAVPQQTAQDLIQKQLNAPAEENTTQPEGASNSQGINTKTGK